MYVQRAIWPPFGMKRPLKIDETLSARVNGEAPKVSHDPTTAEALCDCTRSPAAAEEIGD
jgi:hypothetical protein